MFQLFLTIHITVGAICLILGPIAMFARKKKGLHTVVGELYHAGFVFILITSIVLAILHWETSAYLFYIGIFSYAFACLGYVSAKLRRRNWVGMHISGMLGSYIAVITAVLIVNVSSIPILNKFPPLSIWFLPTIIGAPLIHLVRKRFETPKPKRVMG